MLVYSVWMTHMYYTLNYTHAKQFPLEWQRHFTRDYYTTFLFPIHFMHIVRTRWVHVVCKNECMYYSKNKMQRERENGGREKQTTFDVELQMRRNEKRYLPRKRTNSLLKIGSGRNAHNYTMAMAKTAQIHQYKSFPSLTQCNVRE